MLSSFFVILVSRLCLTAYRKSENGNITEFNKRASAAPTGAAEALLLNSGIFHFRFFERGHWPWGGSLKILIFYVYAIFIYTLFRKLNFPSVLDHITKNNF